MTAQLPGGRPAAGGPDWVRDAVFCQIFPDRFASSVRVPKPGALERWDAPPTFNGFKGGDLLGIVKHLDDLHELGITALYLNPVFAQARLTIEHPGPAGYRLEQVSWPGRDWEQPSRRR